MFFNCRSKGCQTGGLRRFRGWDGKGKGTIAHRGVRLKKNKINAGFVRLVLCLCLFFFQRRNMGCGDLFAARCFQVLCVSQQRPAATQARHREPSFFALALCSAKRRSATGLTDTGSEKARFFFRVLWVGKSGTGTLTDN